MAPSPPTLNPHLLASLHGHQPLLQKATRDLSEIKFSMTKSLLTTNTPPQPLLALPQLEPTPASFQALTTAPRTLSAACSNAKGETCSVTPTSLLPPHHTFADDGRSGRKARPSYVGKSHSCLHSRSDSMLSGETSPSAPPAQCPACPLTPLEFRSRILLPSPLPWLAELPVAPTGITPPGSFGAVSQDLLAQGT